MPHETAGDRRYPVHGNVTADWRSLWSADATLRDAVRALMRELSVLSARELIATRDRISLGLGRPAAGLAGDISRWLAAQREHMQSSLLETLLTSDRAAVGRDTPPTDAPAAAVSAADTLPVAQAGVVSDASVASVGGGQSLLGMARGLHTEVDEEYERLLLADAPAWLRRE